MVDGLSAKFCPNAAEADLGNAEIGGDMPQLYPLQQIGIGLQEITVAFGSSAELPGDEPGFRSYEFLFGKFPAPIGHVDVLPVQAVQVFRFQTV